MESLSKPNTLESAPSAPPVLDASIPEQRRQWRERFRSLLNAPFRYVIDGMLAGFHTSEVRTPDRNAVREATDKKYMPALIASISKAMLATPGLLAMNPSPDVEQYFTVVGVVSGTAWFVMCMEKVKQALQKFGLVTTRNVLQSFLTVVFISFFRANIGITSEATQEVFRMISDAGIDVQALLDSKFLRMSEQILTVGVISEITYRLVSGVIQYDAIDTTNAGSTPLALAFFTRSISDLRNAAASLDYPNQSFQLANVAIARGLNSFYSELLVLGREDQNLGNRILALMSHVNCSSYEFDSLAIPIVQKIFNSLQKLMMPGIDACDEVPRDLDFKFRAANILLSNIDSMYKQNGNQIPQSSADSVWSVVLTTLADLLEHFGDRIDLKSSETQEPMTEK